MRRARFHRTYIYNERRYGYYQPNGYGHQYPGQKQPNQYPLGVPLGEDKFKYDPVIADFLQMSQHFFVSIKNIFLANNIFVSIIPRIIRIMCKRHFLAFWEGGAKTYKGNNGETHYS